MFVLLPAMNLASALEKKKAEQRTLPVTAWLLDALTRVSAEEDKGPPLPSDDEDEDDINFDNANEEAMNDQAVNSTQIVEDEGFFKFPGQGIPDLNDELVLPSLAPAGEDNSDNEEESDGIRWKFSGRMGAPINIAKNKKTQLKAEHKMKFVTPLSSFLAFVPIEFWKLYVFRTNTNGEKKYNSKVESKAEAGEIYRGRIWSDISLKEFMTFIGMLIDMTTRPSPGLSYFERWKDEAWHPYTKKMSLGRFNDVRSALHMSELIQEGQQPPEDALFKIRPLLNVVKKTLGSYVIPGSDLSLDESSIACRSKYGRNLIFFNNTKPCGKYHFRFYIVTDVDHYAALRLRVHTKNNSDTADGIRSRLDFIDSSSWKNFQAEDNENEDAILEEKEQPKLVSLVVDMALPWFNTGRVLNMDNYYTSPMAFMELRKNGLYCRGTCRSNRRYFPEVVQYTKVEARKSGRGSMKVATNSENGMVAMGWVDGNPVHFLTTADGTESSVVRRRVQSEVQVLHAPIAIKHYNHGMQGVDRFDQLVALYSLAKNHCFKKYYNKLAMGLLDFALTNAEIHYFMANPEEKKKRNHRYLFRVGLCRAMYETDWDDHFEEGTPVFQNKSQSIEETTEDGTAPCKAIKQGNVGGFSMAPSFLLTSPASDVFNMCQPISVAAFLKRNNDRGKGLSYGGIHCQICLFEGRSRLTNTVVLCAHGVRCCSISRKGSQTPLSNVFVEKKKTGFVQMKIPLVMISFTISTCQRVCLEKHHR